MNRFTDEKRNRYTDFAAVESQRNDLNLEEFPEGPYGADLHPATVSKSQPWRIDQQNASRFDYENHALHAGMERDYPGEDVRGHAIPEVQDEP
ncbi:conserved hypothetical protein [Paenibacillus curdlanolyticus YK9]|uniref:Cytosolic protein n=1 Tax=Paenibacillus curdlanolyticus YK9 TaxID=717606 RepID=E0I6C5_9BACL|nr:hypothetical protein [Paenibacillus curdlanolyticus]EFM11591.1 conserved hypothetical protein [Paenibacillus curdlanolyticus YK9]